MSHPPDYLDPYHRAAARHGADFPSLLWTSPQTQAARFDAMMRLVDFSHRSILDAGCGRADFVDHLLGRGVKFTSCTGIEAVPQLADAARQKNLPRTTILQADFLADPRLLDAGADIITFSGSLNTLDHAAFYAILNRAFAAARQFLLFNFLSSPDLAAADYLHWRRTETVLHHARSLSPRVRKLEDYLPGDCTIAIAKAENHE